MFKQISGCKNVFQYITFHQCKEDVITLIRTRKRTRILIYTKLWKWLTASVKQLRFITLKNFKQAICGISHQV